MYCPQTLDILHRFPYTVEYAMNTFLCVLRAFERNSVSHKGTEAQRYNPSQ